MVIGLYNRKDNKILNVGSGFVVDKKNGLIVTAAHTLFNLPMNRDKSAEDYKTLKEKASVVVGVIPNGKDRNNTSKSSAVFRYMADVEYVSPSDLNRLDACVLRIKTRLTEDVRNDLKNLFQEEKIVCKPRREKLKELSVSLHNEHEERIRVLGYNQGGDGVTNSGEVLNRTIDFAEGYICKVCEENTDDCKHTLDRKEIVAICPTIGGHSGGPCVNQTGEVVGILSRADSVEKQRCYIVPSSEFMQLVNRAKARNN